MRYQLRSEGALSTGSHPHGLNILHQTRAETKYETKIAVFSQPSQDQENMPAGSPLLLTRT